MQYTKITIMEKQKLDNGLLPVAYLTNILAPLGIMIYFSVSYLMNPTGLDDLIVLIPLSVFLLISMLMVIRFRKVEFDGEYVYVKNVLNKEIAAFPVKSIRSVKKMVFSFGKSNGRKSGKNYKISYLNADGMEKAVRVMATTETTVVENFVKLTSFLGAEGFNPE